MDGGSAPSDSWRDFLGIGLIEPFWKVIEKAMDTRLNMIVLHVCLHDTIKGRSTGIATTEVKLVQHLAYLNQAPLYWSFV